MAIQRLTGPRASRFRLALLTTSLLSNPDSEETMKTNLPKPSSGSDFCPPSTDIGIIASVVGWSSNSEAITSGARGISLTLRRKGCHPSSGGELIEPLQGDRRFYGPMSQPDS